MVSNCHRTVELRCNAPTGASVSTKCAVWLTYSPMRPADDNLPLHRAMALDAMLLRRRRGRDGLGTENTSTS